MSRNAILLAMTLVVWALFAALQPSILQGQNLYSMVVLAIEAGIVSLGQTFVILGGGGGIDLSVGAIFALSSVIAGLLMIHGTNWVLACLLALLAGIAMGALNGAVIALLRIPPLMTTLATMFAYGGIALLITGGVDVSGLPKAFNLLGQGSLLGLPFQLVIFYLPIVLILLFLERRAQFGRALYLSGTNELAARLSGIQVDRVRFWTYVLAGLLSSIAALIDASRLTVARPDAAGDINLVSITIAVLGGTNIFGGEGSIVGTLLATLTIGSISYGLSYINANPVLEGGVVGLVLLISVLAQNLVRPRARQA